MVKSEDRLVLMYVNEQPSKLWCLVGSWRNYLGYWITGEKCLGRIVQGDLSQGLIFWGGKCRVLSGGGVIFSEGISGETFRVQLSG